MSLGIVSVVLLIMSRLLYAAPVWIGWAAEYRTNYDTMTKAQRLAAVRITLCYRTISTAATLFLAELPPVDFLARERETNRQRRGCDPD